MPVGRIRQVYDVSETEGWSVLWSDELVPTSFGPRLAMWIQNDKGERLPPVYFPADQIDRLIEILTAARQKFDDH